MFPKTHEYNNNQFSWSGKIRQKISKVQLIEDTDKLQSIEISQKKDWSKIVEELKGINSLLHYAICDPNTADVWVSSPEFTFKNYLEETKKLLVKEPKEDPIEKENKLEKSDRDVREITEKAHLLNYFKTQGHVKTVIGMRLLGEKFVQLKYDEKSNITHFVNEKRDGTFGMAGRTSKFILIGIYSGPESKRTTTQMDPSAPQPKRLAVVDPLGSLEKVFWKLHDLEMNFSREVFTENHIIKLKCLFTAPGSYDINRIIFQTENRDQLQYVNERDPFIVTVNQEAKDLLD